MDDEKKVDSRHFFSATVITIGFALFVYSVFFFFPNFPHLRGEDVSSKADLIKEHLLPKDATDIQNLGNGWIVFSREDTEVWRFRHPFSHEVAIDVLRREEERGYADGIGMIARKQHRERRAKK